ncbi:MAG: VTT domain-containing protein [Patescibacteria group bacterium]
MFSSGHRWRQCRLLDRKKFGRRLFEKKDSLLFKKRHLEKAEEFYQEHGGKAIIIARFMPIVRTFAPIVAGIAQMDYSKFLSFNVFGGLFWVLTTLLGGYFLGAIPGADKYFHYLIIGVIVVSLLPSAIHFWKEYKADIFKKIKSFKK